MTVPPKSKRVVPADGQEDEYDEDLACGPPPPDGGWGWMVVFGSFMIHIVTDGVSYCFGIFYDEFLTYFNEDQKTTSLIPALLVGVTLCSGPISSSLVNKWGCRTVTILGSILATICLLISVFATNVTYLCITIGVGTGLGFGLIYLPAIVSVTSYFEKKRSLATGIAVCGSGLGTFIFAPIITKLMFEYGWRGSILIIAGITLECIIFGSLFRPLEEEEEENKLEVDIETAPPIEIRSSTIGESHDLHRNLTRTIPHVIQNQNGVGKMHRPHSVAHFSTYKSNRYEPNGNILHEKLEKNGFPRLALSQPMLSTVYSKHGDSQQFRRQGPLDRPDAFYQGSLMNIPYYRSRMSLRKGESATHLKSKPKFSKLFHDSESQNEQEVRRTDIASEEEDAPKSSLAKMLDLTLFTDWIFLLFTLSNFLTSIGFNVPYVYIYSRGLKAGLSKNEASMLLSIIGIANTLGRIVLGYLSDKPWVNRLMIYNWSLTICGAATILSAFCNTFITLALYTFVFGFTIGAYVGLTSVILVDLLGLEKLTNAFGLLLLFQGIASLAGPPIAGALYDVSGSYDAGFYMAGITVALSGIILFLIPPIQKCQSRRGRSAVAKSVEDDETTNLQSDTNTET